MSKSRAEITAKWVRTKADAKAVADGCYFDLKAAQHVVDFFEQFLCHSSGKWAGKPFRLQEWQKREVLMPLFGWKRENGKRRFRVGYVEIPKKNGKSAMCSGLSLYMLVGDGEPGAEVYSAAADRQQASIVFDEAAHMVRASKSLAGRLDVIDSRKTIYYPATQSKFRALAADSDSNEGLKIHSLVFDELHAQKSPKLWDSLRYGGASREQPMVIAITTAGVDRHSIAWEQHQYAERIIDGTLQDDTAFFAYIRAAGPDDDWKLPETWRKANPSLGVTIAEDDFAADCKEAQEVPRKLNPFLRYRLNLWTQQEHRWLSMDAWNLCDDECDPVSLRGRRCYVGLDLSAKIDLTAAVLVFPPTPEDPIYRVLPRFWVPTDHASRREDVDHVPYQTWMDQGDIIGIDGPCIDLRVIREQLEQDARDYDVAEIAFDPWSATQLATEMQEAGAVMVECRQGFKSLSEPSKELERLVMSKMIAHGGHPVLRWCAGNAAVDQDSAGNIKPAKNKSTERIDGIVALVVGLSRAMVNSNEPQGSKLVWL